MLNEIKCLKDIGIIVTGKTPDTKKEDYWGGDINFITPRDMKQGKFIKETERRVTKKGFDSVINNALPKKSICVSCIGSDMGKVFISEGNVLTNQQINSIIVDTERYDLDFIYYSLLMRADFLRSLGKSATSVPIVNKSSFERLELAIPPIYEQHQIAKVLSILDDQIELNNKINQALEDFAQTLYNYWFVQFEFPNKEGKPYKSSGGKMIWNEELKREIPEGWEVKNILDISETVWGNCPPGENILPLDTDDENAIPYCSGAGDMSGNIIVSPKAMTNNSKRMVKENTVLVSVAGTIGKTCLSDKKISIGRATLGISALDETHYGFIYFLIKSFCNRFNTIAIGAIQKIINSNHLTEINFAFNENLNCYKKINELLEAIILNEKQNQELAQLRDYLLPLLMNGQVGFSDEGK